MNSLTDIFDFFLPRFCASCKTKLLAGENVVCYNCLSKIRRADPIRIILEYERKFKESSIISDFYPLYIFEKEKEVQQIIHQLKYNQRFLIGMFLGENLGRAISNTIRQWQIDIVVPIPLHHLKKAERGYNQSLYIAKGLNKILRIPVNSRIIKRKKFTQSQTTMNLEEREQNIKDAFSIKKNSGVQNKNILLVDDVITTGATIRECGKLMLNYGANKVYAASIAVAD
ncbi:MAG: ComF family protein [Ignavibacteriaceae bacterium]